MSTTVSMPQLGETVTEGTVLRWMKHVGDRVAEEEPIVEISTDKVDTEVPSPVAGVISEILVGEGETIGVGTAMVVIADAAEAVTAPAAPSSPAPGATSAPPEVRSQDSAGPCPAEVRPAGTVPPSAPPPAPPTPTKPRTGRRAAGFLSPVVRRLAREHDIDPSDIEGTGRDGRVTRNDVLAYIDRMASREAPEAAPPAEAPPPPSPAAHPPPRPAPAPPGEPAPAPPTSPATEPPAADRTETARLSRLRVRIADNMIKSLRTAAHVWTSVEVDYETVERVRQAHRRSFKEAEGFSLTYLPFIARAVIDALREFPVVNSSFEREERQAVYHHEINLGIAIDLNQNGLMVATVKKADGYTMRGMARKIRDVADRARSGRVGPDDVTGSTFTITNPGPYGSFMSAPVINVPNVAILSTDTVAKRPAVVTTSDGQDVIAIRHIGYLGLSWDHRALDGSTAVLFLRRIKDNLETWDWEQHLT